MSDQNLDEIVEQSQRLYRAFQEESAASERYRTALTRIAEWDGDEHYLDDVEVELKAIARKALGSEEAA